MTWPFENDTSAIVKKLARRSFHHERQRNLFAIIALALTSFMITAVFSIGFSYFETYQMQQIRLMGQNEEIKNMSELKSRITENGSDYILVGDYYIPNLKLPATVSSLTATTAPCTAL